MSQTDEYDVMVVEVKELESRCLNMVVYDTRPDVDATFVSGIEEVEATEEDPEWKQQASDELDGPSLMKYVDHEWKNITLDYADVGVIKNGPRMERKHERIVVQNPTSLTPRIERVDNTFILTVEADGATLFHETMTDSDLSLEEFPPSGE